LFIAASGNADLHKRGGEEVLALGHYTLSGGPVHTANISVQKVSKSRLFHPTRSQPGREPDNNSSISEYHMTKSQISPMSEPLFYREIQFSRSGGALPEKVGSFVVGIPIKAVEEYRMEHPAEGIDAVFRNLISAKEKQHMGDLLGVSNPSLDEQPF
jgi:hypothetical protein